MALTRARLLAELGTILAADCIQAHKVGAASDENGRLQARARKARLIMERLGPFHIKVGQILATRPDFVSEVMMEELAVLQQDVTVEPFPLFEDVLREELNGDWRRFFRSIDCETPVGSASLAQAYKAVLRSGEPVVVKVQRPGIRATIYQDMASLRRIVHLAARVMPPRVDAVVDIGTTLGVMFDAMKAELDFRVEARTMDEARRAAVNFRHISVPEVIIATPRIIVQSLAPGTNIRDARLEDFSSRQRLAIGRDLLAFMYHGYFIEKMFHADPHPGNIFVDPDHGATIIDWGMVGRLDRTLSTMGMLTMLSIAQNDARGVAHGWIQMGHATQWADIPGFTDDMIRLLPQARTKSLDELNYGTVLMTTVRDAAKRGIRTSPMIGLFGKSFCNIEGSVRYLAPELSVVKVFREVVVDVLVEHARELVSMEQTGKFALDAMLGAMTGADQGRGLLRDISNRDLAIKVGVTHHSSGPGAQGSLLTTKGLALVALAVLGGWGVERRLRGLHLLRQAAAHVPTETG
jgi:ubiquinone biosynthesis protein